MNQDQGYARHFAACNRHDLSHFIPFYIGDKRYGRVKKETAAFLLERTNLFDMAGDGLRLAQQFETFAANSDALMQAANALIQRFSKALRNEMYPVIENWGDAPLAQLDRVAVPWFGVRAWGLHVNGFVRKKDGLYLWIGERAADRQIEPGKLDNMIGGGNPIGITLEQNLCKEAKEEAGLDEALALTAKKVSSIDYMLELPDGLRDDTLIIYDLELPESFMPQNTDGEVAKFSLLSLPEAASLVRNTDKFKFNCGMVVADFLMRHKYIMPSDSEYCALKTWLEK